MGSGLIKQGLAKCIERNEEVEKMTADNRGQAKTKGNGLRANHLNQFREIRNDSH